jgi:threonine dehydratase
LGIHAVVGLGLHVPENKVRDIRGYGAETLIAGSNWDETCAAVAIVEKERNLTYISPFDDPDIIAGQGTMILEVIKKIPDLDTIIVPLSGGGLAGGVALTAKYINPAIRVIGVSQQISASMYESIRAGKIVEVPEPPTLADALLGGIGMNNRYTFDICRNYLDGTLLVSEEEIGEAMAFLFDRHHLVVEGGGAVSTAALLQQRVKAGGKTLVIVSGGSVDAAVLSKLAQKYLS